jgi:hypothetical protein
MGNPRYNKIQEKIQSLAAELSALWMQPGGGKNIDPSKAESIATGVLPDLEGLVNETRANIARHAENKAKRKAKAQSPRKEKRDFAQTAFSVFQKATGVKVNSQRHSRSGRGK